MWRSKVGDALLGNPMYAASNDFSSSFRVSKFDAITNCLKTKRGISIDGSGYDDDDDDYDDDDDDDDDDIGDDDIGSACVCGGGYDDANCLWCLCLKILFSLKMEAAQ
ncbi:hypothetical protein ElyMa_005657600 [Elysia marginata]|uniref:Uncharacterized protein n=1 Tax=Elysia marginata TaxID=1093978 RepID=A0AAV4FBG2_9GAST|nr:hypothetical protein ElyMa_005657600 [Elysia marginata]